MAEINIGNEPAVTYQLNVLASAIGRFAVPDMDLETIQQAADMCEQAIDAIRGGGKPAVPHTNPVLLQEAQSFDEKLRRQLVYGSAQYFLPKNVLDVALETVDRHTEVCAELANGSAAPRLLVDPSEIADAYGITDLWDGTEEMIDAEADRWAMFCEHPRVPKDLEKPVSAIDTASMMKIMWDHVIGIDEHPVVRTYLTKYPEAYHVYWAPLADKLDYTTPTTYDRATQLSFDIPHNATHLAHLDAISDDLGVFRYDDSMSQRAFFEAAAVYSELRGMEEARTNPGFTAKLSEALNLRSMSSEELAEWIAQDRGYEFKLRAARYAADTLMIRGASFEETVHEVADALQIPLADSEKESRKYIAWTGLGAVYTAGYRKLEQSGIVKVKDVLVDTDGRAITSWRQFENQGANK